MENWTPQQICCRALGLAFQFYADDASDPFPVDKLIAGAKEIEHYIVFGKETESKES